ncbi:VWA domain-containing protein [Jatrophihabitans endophyticus]|uniref:VWA domain-containing protein n=1 Tax=Jatrophihabitans endophyticus TaxID=1206085 RepID=UPI0019DB2C10|nr:VWA domain-containing protein [Jatrophihabitans endophyticus]MBE7187880.1 VWA domain-containing protein [Jatrophihabitans endophyticus]
MEESIHRFVRLLRLSGVRIGVSEAVDGMRALSVAGIAADRELTRAALRVSLVKDRRDEATFDRVFDRFFRLRRVLDDEADEHGHSHDDLSDSGELDTFSLSEDAGDTPQDGHSHGKPVDIRQFFDDEDMAQQYNLHQEANRLDMASMTDEIVLSDEARTDTSDVTRVQLTTSRLHNPGRPGEIAKSEGLKLDVELSVAEEMALLSWLSDDVDDLDPDEIGDLDDEELAALRRRLSGLLERLPDALKRHLESLMAGDLEIEKPDVQAPPGERIDERERADLEEAVRRLLRSLHGAPRPRRRVAARGTVDGARTMRANMRFDGVPFKPVTVARVADRPRLLLLVDVSLSVRTAARFTLQLVHGLQSMASTVRSFAFVSDLVEITDLFDDHPLEDALGLVMAGLPAGGVLDVDADSDYGNALGEFLEDHGGAITRRTTVIVLGDGRGNGKDPNFGAIAEISRRARELIWLTPEPRYSWALGSCDLPAYAGYCDRVHVVRDLAALDRVTGMALAGPARAV